MLPPVYVKGEPPVNVTSNAPAAAGTVVVALCATVMPEIAVVQVVDLRLVASDEFCKYTMSVPLPVTPEPV